MKHEKGYIKIRREKDVVKCKGRIPRKTLAFIVYSSNKPDEDFVISFTKRVKPYLTSGCDLFGCRSRDDKLKFLITHEVMHKAISDVGIEHNGQDWDYMDKKYLISGY